MNFASLTSITSSPIFWIILAGAFIFIIYSGFKKRKAEKKNRNKREQEVKVLIKNHIKDTKNLKNITIEYVDVIPRTGKLYRSRDVFDVFVNIFNKKKDKKTIFKQAYEIEGVASQDSNSKNKDDVVVHWAINQEFDYESHAKLLKFAPNSKWKIYWRCLFKPNRKKYLKEELQNLKNRQNKEKLIHDELKKKKNLHEETAFRPKMKKSS